MTGTNIKKVSVLHHPRQYLPKIFGMLWHTKILIVLIQKKEKV